MGEAIWLTITTFMQANANWFIGLSWVIFSIGALQNLINAVQLPAAFIELRRHSQAEDTESNWQMLVSDEALPMSVLVPAYNEGETIVANIRTMLYLQYPSFEVVVINDGSSDDSLAILIAAFDLKKTTRAHELTIQHAPVRGVYTSKLHPALLVIDKENGQGKADAVNTGLNFCRNPLYCVVDADSVLEPEALLRSVRPYMEEPEEMVAVGGTIRILNGCTIHEGQITNVAVSQKFLPMVQTMEYIRAFLMARLAWSHWGMLSIVSGAFGIFRRDLTMEVGGWTKGSMGEDYDFIVKLHRHMRTHKKPYKMRYVPEPVCWTEAPETLDVLGTQRKRWQRGALEVVFKNKDMLFNPRYGKFGMVAMPNNFLVDVLGPLAELAGYILLPLFWMMGAINGDYMLAFAAIFMLLGVFVSVSTLILEELELKRTPRARDLAMLGLVAVVENFGYRQLNNIWRLQGWWGFLRRDKKWGDMPRIKRS